MTTQFGKYTLVRKLATGGMAEVFLARADGPMGFAKKCVVKRILPHFNDDPRFIEMFLGEARLAAELNHPNVVQIFDFGEANGQYYLAMEYIDGPNVRVLNQASRRMFGPMDFGMAARIICSAADGLHYAHELRDENGTFLNLVHRDISPDNILVSRNGAVKVVDFGIAKASTQPHLTRSGMIKGKMAYMPPEQLAREPLDRRADLFALGIVLYELITGGMPFDATSEVSIIQAIMSQKPLELPSVYRPDIPPQLEAIVQKCLQKDRDQRYPSCRELQADLEAFIASTGKAVGTRDVADLVETVFANEADKTTASPMPSAELDRTTPAGKSQERQVATPVESAEPLAATALKENPVVALPPPSKGRSPAPLIAVGVLVVLALGAALYFTGGNATQQPTQVVDAGAPVATVPLDAGTSAPAVTPAEDAGALAEVETDAGAVAEAELDAGAAEEPHAAVVHHGKLELRIRPYATVYVDDKLLGDTPLPPQTLPWGKHKVRLVNTKLGKDVVLDVTIGSGTNVLKHNLKE